MDNKIITENNPEKYQIDSFKSPNNEIIKETEPAPIDHLPERQDKAIDDLVSTAKEKSDGETGRSAVLIAPAAPSLKGEEKWPYFVEVEKILEDNLSDVYGQLGPAKQREFKVKGEETARIITQILNSTTIKVKRIFNLIIGWLKIIPGVNRFFLEQEAKIKSDQILALRKRK